MWLMIDSRCWVRWYRLKAFWRSERWCVGMGDFVIFFWLTFHVLLELFKREITDWHDTDSGKEIGDRSVMVRQK